MATVTRITLIRHGETHWNRQKIYQGQLDVEGCQLTQQGEAEATALGQRFANEQTSRNFAHIVSSDLGRAYKTAENINKEIGHLQHTTDPRLRERAFGAFEGKSREEVDKIIGSSSAGGVTIDDGESAGDVLKRALEAVESIVCGNIGKHVMLVAHGGTISLLLQNFLGLGLDDACCFKVQNTSVSVVDLWVDASNGERHMRALVRTMGDVAHLL